MGDLQGAGHLVSKGKHSNIFGVGGAWRVSELHSQKSGMIQNEAEVRGQVRARLSGVGDLYDLGYY